MSTCPENDIHSVYLDGELPEEFVEQYEAHVSSCSKCSARLEKLRKLNSIIASDASSIMFTREQLDDSFKRLEARLSYSRFAAEERKFNSSIYRRNNFNVALRYFAAGAAAVLVLALLPGSLVFRGRSAGGARPGTAYVERQFTPVARSSMSKKSDMVRFDGGVDSSHLSSFLSSGNALNSPRGYATLVGDRISRPVMGMAVSNSSIDHGRSAFLLSDYDVFCPEEYSRKDLSVFADGDSYSLPVPLVDMSFISSK